MTNARLLLDRDRREAGLLKSWPQNALRHSYASYHLALHRNAAERRCSRPGIRLFRAKRASRSMARYPARCRQKRPGLFEEQLAMVQSDPTPADFAPKTIAYPRPETTYSRALRRMKPKNGIRARSKSRGTIPLGFRWESTLQLISSG